MCGIAGFLGFGALDASAAAHVAQRMGDALAHRGPDDHGVWTDDAAQVALAHRRLSIIDLSSAGHQPMVSASGRYVALYNGEIYNHAELRAALPEGRFAWRGHSDTETMLAAFETWGVQATLTRMLGMFAIALWDRERRVLTLVRDRAGEKPLYWGRQGDSWLFASELKALRRHPAFRGEVDRDALAQQMFHDYIAAPASIYAGISKLPPGCFVEISLERGAGEPVAYWEWPRHAADAALDDRQAVDGLEAVLQEAVRSQLVGDVPVGAFLSGGIDSSTIVALMQSQSAQPVRTFTIGFHEDGFDEAAHARAVARHLGTDHTELYVTAADALAVIPTLARVYDEPFSDSSQIPTLLVSQLARTRVTVSLSGDGADELLGGYTRYRSVARAWSSLARMPAPLRRAGAFGIRALPVPMWNLLATPARPFLPPRSRNVGHKAHKFAALMDVPHRRRFYDRFNAHWPFPEQLVVGGRIAPAQEEAQASSFEDEMMRADAHRYLPDDILVKVDRAAMAHSLETRVPFLDPRVIDFAARLPLSMKLRAGQGKWVLRQVLDRHVPRALVDRPKTGFSVPIGAWLRGPLRDWAQALLAEDRLRREGFFHPAPVRQAWQEHLSGRRDWHAPLWDVLMFQLWLQEQRADT